MQYRFNILSINVALIIFCCFFFHILYNMFLILPLEPHKSEPHLTTFNHISSFTATVFVSVLSTTSLGCIIVHAFLTTSFQFHSFSSTCTMLDLRNLPVYTSLSILFLIMICFQIFNKPRCVVFDVIFAYNQPLTSMFLAHTSLCITFGVELQNRVSK